MDDTSLIPVACEEIYPPTAVCKPNLIYAKMLIPALLYPKSETSAIMTYVYQHWTLSCDYPMIGNTIFRIAQVEMHHLDIVGELVTLLGMRPGFCANRRNCWNGNMIDYSTDIKCALKNNIKDEEAASHFYLSMAKEIKDEKISVLLNRLAMDEELHVSIFRSMLSNL